MPAPKYAQKKDTNQGGIVSELIQAGCSVYVMHVPCDLLVGHRGHTYLVEIKQPTRAKRKTKAQIDFAATWRGQYLVATSSEQILRAIGAMQ